MFWSLKFHTEKFVVRRCQFSNQTRPARTSFRTILQQKQNKISKIKIRGELQLWINKWKTEESKVIPDKAVDLISFCDEDLFPMKICLF